MVTLATLPEGKEAVVIGIIAGRGLARRLAELGFMRGEKVKILRSGPGPVLVLVKGSKIALGWGVARKILVRDSIEEET
ncbi:ferrous iron transport protein A [Candidatus Bathyarchaeota archaeon ex4484_135]|nr:MAG: ferrous iron transport protein A [Candidatus Bathyarchaeota archaeon ex4484_135]